MNNAAATARAHDDTEDQFLSPARPKQRLGQRETVGVVLDLNFPAKNPFDVRFQRLPFRQTVLEFFSRPVRGEMALGVPMPNVCAAP